MGVLTLKSLGKGVNLEELLLFEDRFYTLKSLMKFSVLFFLLFIPFSIKKEQLNFKFQTY